MPTLQKYPKIKTELNTQTSGDGCWSRTKKTVKISKLEIAYLSLDKSEFFGELRAYFKKKNWNVNEDGLIYTDKLWLDSFKSELKNLGFSDKALAALNYSEQGMQGEDYVSLDIADDFVKNFSLIKTFGKGFN